MARVMLCSSSQLPAEQSESKCTFSNIQSCGKSQRIQLKIMFLQFLKFNKQSIEEMLGDGKNLVCFDLFYSKKRVNRVMDWESVTDLETARKCQLLIQCAPVIRTYLQK